MWRAAGAGRGHEIWVCRRCQSGGGGISVSGGEGCCLRAKGRTEGDRLPFCGKPGRMTDLAPDGRARLAGKKGTDIGEVRGEGRFFAGNEAARGLSGEEVRVQQRRGRIGKERRKTLFPKKSGASEENVRMRAGDFCGKKRGLISDGAGTSKAESRYMQRRRPPARVRKSLRKEQSRLSGGGPEKNKTPTDRGFGSASGGPHPHYFKGN